MNTLSINYTSIKYIFLKLSINTIQKWNEVFKALSPLRWALDPVTFIQTSPRPLHPGPALTLPSKHSLAFSRFPCIPDTLPLPLLVPFPISKCLSRTPLPTSPVDGTLIQQAQVPMTLKVCLHPLCEWGFVQTCVSSLSKGRNKNSWGLI